MNKHIELVKKWLADKDSVSREELEVNSAEASGYDAYAAADIDDAAYANAAAADASAADAAWADADSAAWAVRAAALYAALAARAPDAVHAADEAAHWVERYEELTSE